LTTAITTPLLGQASAASDRVRAAVVASLDAEARDSVRWAVDSAGVYERYVTCRPYQGKQACALRDGKDALAIGVGMQGPDSAVVTITTFWMAYEVCPNGPKLDPPLIVTLVRGSTWVRREGRWIDTKTGWVTTC
jgi:hypothetical protein